MSFHTPFRAALGPCMSLLVPPAQGFTFTGLDGTPPDLEHWRGQPVLVANTRGPALTCRR